MSRARELSKIANINTFAVDSTDSQVGIASTVPNATLDVGGDGVFTGIITAASFSGDGSALTGVANTAYVVSIATTTGDLTVSAAATIGGAVNIDATTDSTSTSTGALIVDGGVGIAKNVYIGAGLSIAGTLTYEDVTNVDAVGLITAKSGVNISGGQLQVGTAYSVGYAGVVTAQNVTISAGTIDLKNSGSVSNIKFYCESANAHYTTLQSAAHSAYSGNVTLTLPATTDTLIGKTTTDTLTNKTLTSPTLTTPVFSGAVTGELKVGSGITMAATAGVVTFANAANENSNTLKFGDNNDLTLRHDGANYGYFKNNTGTLFIQNSNGNTSVLVGGGANPYTAIYYGGSAILSTTNDGVTISGICTASAAAFSTGDGVLREKCYVVANKMSAFSSANISLISGMVWYYTTQETTTSTPNIRFSSGIALNSVMDIGEVITVTVITTAAAAGYSANWTIDGNAVTEEWVGGSAPTAGGSDGLDIYSLTIIKTADATFTVIANLTNASN